MPYSFIDHAIGAARAKREEEAAEQRERMEERDRRSEELRQERDNFMKQAGVVPLPTALYAAWLGFYLNYGGRIAHTSQDNFNDSHSHIITDDRVISFSTGIDFFLATAWPRGLRMPTGYGADSMNIMVLPDLLPECDLSPTSGDGRPGWEYGHSEVYVLRSNPGSHIHNVIAETNETDGVRSFPDVEEMIYAHKDNLEGLLKMALEDLQGTPKQDHDAVEER